MFNEDELNDARWAWELYKQTAYVQQSLRVKYEEVFQIFFEKETQKKDIEEELPF